MSTSGESLPGGANMSEPGASTGADLASQIAQLANQLFQAPPGGSSSGSLPGASPVGGPGTLLPGSIPTLSPLREPPVPTPPAAPAPPTIASPGHRGPSALQPGLSGMSTAANGPPLPGILHTPPLAAAPPPREGDLRGGVTQFAEQAGLPVQQLVSPTAIDAPPYFLGLAGLPGAQPPSVPPSPGLPGPSVPSSPGIPGPSVSGAQMPTPNWDGLHAPTNVPSFGVTPTGLESAVPGPPQPKPALPSAVQAQPPGARPAPRAELAEFRPQLLEFQPQTTTLPQSSRGAFDPNVIKADFPILKERVHGRQIVWLDNAATTQKPQAVIDRLSHYYEHENSNIHRAAHTLAARATDAYEGAREKVRRFLNAPNVQDIVFTRGATEAINLVAKSWGHRNIGANDEILITWLEHHANIVPWQQLAAEKGAVLRVAPVDDDGQVILEEFEKLLGPRTRMVSVTQVSNALGTITPAREMVEMAHRHGAVVLVDGAQAVSHMPVDVQALDADFYVFSGHKVFAPTGIGALYGRSAILQAMPPWQGGGNMIQDVRFERTTYHPPPFRFEAGTGNIADAAGLGAAIDYVSAIGLQNISRYEHELLEYGTECLQRIPGLHIIGNAREKAGVLSFVIDGVRTEDLGSALDKEGIAVRAGHHCAQPILRRYGLEATVRASLAPYNTREDLEALAAALVRITGRTPKTVI